MIEPKSEIIPDYPEAKMEDVHKVLLTLGKNESLWSSPLSQAMDQILETANQGIGADAVSIWQFTGQGEQLVCVARRERLLGKSPVFGALTASEYPAYFAALNAERVLAAQDALSDVRTADLIDPLKPLNLRAMLDATIRRAGKVAGVLCCEQRDGPRQWTPPQIELAVGLADLTGQLIVLSELRRRDQLQSLLLSLAPELGQNHTEKELAELALKKLVQLFPRIWAAFYQPDLDPEFLRVIAHHAPGAPVEYVDSLRRIPLSTSIMGIAMSERRIVAVRENDLQNLNQGEQTLALRINCSIGIPLLHDTQLIGGVIIGIRDNDVIGDDELASFSLASTTFAVALANARNVEQLRHRALHDSLTGLPNQDKLHADIAKLAEGRAEAPSLTMLLLGIKDFKQVNDTLGRGRGDRILITLSQRAALFAKLQGGVAYRLTGDEFAVLLRGNTSDTSQYAMAMALQQCVGEPIEISGLTLIPRPRIGVASLPRDGRDEHDLLQSADIARGWAATEASGISVYNLARDTSGPRSLEMMADLRKAMDTDQLSLHLQPKISIRDRRLVACEALLRWTHPRYGAVPPTNFIAVAEKGELMGPLTLWVAKRALQHARELRQAGLHISIAINVSAHNMVDAEFPRQLQALLVESGMTADAITLEITETVLMSDPDQAAKVIAELAAIGLALDIDDFGTGYSSLSYLRRLPLKSLKIDRAFVMELTANAQDVHIVQSTVGLAHGLGLVVIAEGVEDQATLDLLGDLGCDMAQGYTISKPLPVDGFIQWAHGWGSGR